MLRTKLVAFWNSVKFGLLIIPGLVGMLLGVDAALEWALRAGLSLGSFLLGFVAAIATLYLQFLAMEKGPAEHRKELHRLACARQRAETNSAFWMARHARLECERARRKLREEDWRGDGP